MTSELSFKERLEIRIDDCRICENECRIALSRNDDMLWGQLGGPMNACDMMNIRYNERIKLQEIYYELFGEWYDPKAFNENVW